MRDFTGTVEQFLAGVEAQYSEKTNVTVDGYSGIRAKSTSIVGVGYSYTLKKDDKIVNIYLGSADPAGVALLDSLVSTFKFTTSTAGWKTYTNTQNGFMVKYPSSWDLHEQSSNTSTGLLVMLTPPNFVPEVDYFVVGIDTRTLAEIRRVMLSGAGSSETAITVGGVPAYRFYQGTPGPAYIVIPHLGKNYFISALLDSDSVPKILSTFTFTNPYPSPLSSSPVGIFSIEPSTARPGDTVTLYVWGVPVGSKMTDVTVFIGQLSITPDSGTVKTGDEGSSILTFKVPDIPVGTYRVNFGFPYGADTVSGQTGANLTITR